MASPAILQLFHPNAQPFLGKQSVLCHFPFSQHIDPAARQPLSPAPDDNLLYVLSASLPRLSAFSLFMRYFLRRCIFSYNIMSDLDFPKSTLSRLEASPGVAPGWAGPSPRPLLRQAGANPSPLPHPIQGITIHIFISKAISCTSATNPS